MPDYHDSLTLLGLIVVVSPLLVTIVLGASSLMSWKLSETATTKIVYAAIATGLLAAVIVLATMLISGTRHVPIDLGNWVDIQDPDHEDLEHHHYLYHFSIKFVFDRLSVPFAILTFILSGTIGAFASRYMHRERGFNRFFVLYSIFVLGMIVTALAGTIETYSADGSLSAFPPRSWWRFSRSGRLLRETASGCGSSTAFRTRRCFSRRS